MPPKLYGMKRLHSDTINLLQSLIRTPSFSGSEERTAELIQSYLEEKGVKTSMLGNNVYAFHPSFDPKKKTLILNSHHDTVKVVDGWKSDPFGATMKNGRIIGLGSNDAGASLVALLAAFVHYYDQPLDFNLVMVASAEEETSGPGGVRSVLELFDFAPDAAIIGEPTGMDIAIAEKGLLVVDGTAEGQAGHAARDLGINAIYIALEDIANLRKLGFDRDSAILGPTRLSVTQIEAGRQHNVIPDNCHFVVDVRVNEHYTNTEVLELMKSVCRSSLKPRSTHLNSSSISADHPLVRKGLSLGRKTFGSPTLSDQVHFTCPSIKMGPGMSERSHTAEEFILVDEVQDGINTFIEMIDQLIL